MFFISLDIIVPNKTQLVHTLKKKVWIQPIRYSSPLDIINLYPNQFLLKQTYLFFRKRISFSLFYPHFIWMDFWNMHFQISFPWRSIRTIQATERFFPGMSKNMSVHIWLFRHYFWTSWTRIQAWTEFNWDILKWKKMENFFINCYHFLT